MPLQYADFVTITDLLTNYYLACKGDGVNGAGGIFFGAGDSTQTVSSDWGMSKAARRLEAAANAAYNSGAGGDGSTSQALFGAFQKLAGIAPYQNQLNLIAAPVRSLTQVCRATGLAGVNSIDSYATYYNTLAGGPWNALLAPDFVPFHLAIFGVAPTPLNVYSHAPAGGMGSRTVGSAFVVGTAVNTALYGGVARCEVVTTSFAGSSVTVTVTGTNDLGNTGRTWTATVAANGSVVLTPGVSTDLLVSVSGITIPGGMTAGTVTVQGLPPAGRTDPPV